MSFVPFNDDDFADAKAAFAEAWHRERMTSPFKPDPFKAALSVWPDEADLPRALWVAHSAKWHEDPEVIEIADEIKAEAVEAVKEEKIALVNDKTALKQHLMLKLIAQIDVEFDSDKVVKLANEIAKYGGLHEKPDENPDAGRVLGVIHHRLEPMTHEQYAATVKKQQAELQSNLIELAATDVRHIN